MKIRAFFFSLLILGGFLTVPFLSHAAPTLLDHSTIKETTFQKENPDLIKELILSLKNKMEINSDQLPELIQEVEAYTATCSDSASVALLHSMTAELYQNYYKQNRWTIDQRTQLVDFIPEDIREWTSNLFKEKIEKELALSLRPAKLLQDTNARSFSVLLKTGKDSESLRSSLYEFLAFRAIEIQPSTTIYKQIIAFQNKEPNMKAVLLTELDYYRFLYDQRRDRTAYDQYFDALNDLYRNTLTQEYAVEVLIAKLNLVRGSKYRHHSNHWENIKAEEIEICQEGIRRFPNYPRTAVLRNRLAELERPSLAVSTPNIVYPGEKMALKVSYENIDRINVKIFRSLKNPLEAEKTKNIYRSDEKRGELVKELNFTLHLPNSFTQQDTTLLIPMEEFGLYECFIQVPNKNIRTLNTFSVSKLAAIYRGTSPDLREVIVTDFQTGKPIAKAKVTFYKDRAMRLQEVGSVTTDKNGVAILPNDKPISAIQASKGEDASGLLSSVYFRTEDRIPQKEKMEVSLFTDRGIYRPGQTIFFKGLAYEKETDTPHSISNHVFQIRLQDAKGKEIAKKELKTNEFGSFHGEFQIPRHSLGGSFRLSTGTANTYVRVEEYKRPSFKASFLPIQEAIAFNDSVTILGKAETFSGIALPEGKVQWRITRRPFWLRSYIFQSANKTLSEGETQLSANGTFSLGFRPQKEEVSPLLSAYQTYEVFATVTDSKGETQETRYSFVVGESSLVLSSDLPQQVSRDATRATIQSYTVNGEKKTISGTFRIIALTEKSQGLKKNDFEESQDIISGHFTSDQIIDPTIFQRLPSGRYRLAFTATDDRGRLCKNYTDFVLYGTQDKRPPVFSHTWVLQEKTACLPGENAKIIFGTSDKDAYILYEWFVDQKRIYSERIRLNNENRPFSIPFQTSYGKGLVASFTFVKEGELYVTQVPIKAQTPNRNLTIRPTTFRDHLIPGGKESWQFRITDADSTLVSAEILASMYDASLDRIIPFNWYFSPERHIHLQAPKYAAGSGFLRNHQYDQQSSNLENVAHYEFDRLNWFDLFYTPYKGYFTTTRNRMLKTAQGQMMEFATNDAILNEKSVEQDMAPVPEDTEQNKGTQTDVHELRSDFSETAFFYPTLRTNQVGDFLLDFEIPESNTTWKLQVLANTNDLKYGLFTQEVVTNKPLMVIPNLPRFVRQGDQVSISTQVVNHSKATTSGRVSIELFDPRTEEPVICLSKALRMFELRPDSMETVSWTIPVPKQIDLLGVRILARSEQSSDGESHILPVLSSQLLITESKPFYLLEPGNKQLKVANLSDGKRPFRLTLELTSNPIWYAVQALPTLSEPTNENILSWFAAYFSNTLSTHIAQANPRIQEVISQWMAQGGNEQTLYSNLEKNQELKNVLLEETPWVLAANKESEQKQRLSLLFDLNRGKNLREAALQQLIQQQNPEGGWSWFKGLPNNRAITLSILEGMTQLSQLQAIQFGSQETEMQIKALHFLDKCILKDYEWNKKWNKDWQNTLPRPEQIRYLYIRSAYRDIPELGEAREAIRFYTHQAEKLWRKVSLLEKGEIAILMERNGKKNTANDILDWLRKTATMSKEQGMYWANNRRGNDYFSSPIETHCLLMSAFNEIDPDTKRTDLMKQWLLGQKRTQDWESEPATLQAIHALLLTGSDWLTNKNQCSVQWNQKTYHSSEGEIGTGYMKKVLPQPKQQSTTTHTVLNIQKEGVAPAWGAIYEQYFQDIQDVEKQKGALNVEKRLFIETSDGENRQIRPITQETTLQVGDKVVIRLTIRNDREMDYVHLKDQRTGCFEPIQSISKTETKDGVWFYRSPKDVSENFFFQHLPKGTFVIEYPVYVSRPGKYAGGISTIQCMYAPEYISHTESPRIRVEK